MIKAIIFDMGGVITNYSTPGFQILADLLDVDYKKLLALFINYRPALGKNEMTAKEFCDILAQELKPKTHKIVQLWKRAYAESILVDKKMLEYISKLKNKGYKIGLISNVPKLHAEIIRKKGLYEPFDVVILSYKVKLLKPDKQIYDLALKKLKLKPEECVILDDQEKNIAILKTRGFDAIRFESCEQLVSELISRGVLV